MYGERDDPYLVLTRLAERLEGVGLHSMRERAQELGGSFELTAVSPSGTRIRAELPLAQRV